MRNVHAMHARSCLDTAGFIRTQGGDTLSVELAVFKNTGVNGVSATRSATIRYETDITNRLVVVRLRAERWARGQSLTSEPTIDAWYRLVRDTAFFEVRDLRPPIRHQVVARDASARLDGIVGLDELLTRRSPHRESTIATFDPATGTAGTAHVFFVDATSLTLYFADDVKADVRIDPAGRIRAASYWRGAAPAITVQRVACGVIEPIIRRWAK
jgi:hypothetical protein